MPRTSRFPGKDKPATFTLQANTKAKLATLAEAVGCSRSDFVNGLIEHYGPTLAAEMLAARTEDDEADEDQANARGLVPAANLCPVGT